MDKKELNDMRVFPVIEGLEELERDAKWEEARVMLYDLWTADKDNINFFMRLSSECWFLVAEWEVEKTDGLDWEIFHDTLIECMKFTFKRNFLVTCTFKFFKNHTVHL